MLVFGRNRGKKLVQQKINDLQSARDIGFPANPRQDRRGVVPTDALCAAQTSGGARRLTSADIESTGKARGKGTSEGMKGMDGGWCILRIVLRNQREEARELRDTLYGNLRRVYFKLFDLARNGYGGSSNIATVLPSMCHDDMREKRGL